MTSPAPASYWTATDRRIARETRADHAVAVEMNADNFEQTARPMGTWPHAQRRRRG